MNRDQKISAVPKDPIRERRLAVQKRATELMRLWAVGCSCGGDDRDHNWHAEGCNLESAWDRAMVQADEEIPSVCKGCGAPVQCCGDNCETCEIENEGEAAVQRANEARQRWGGGV